MALGAESCSLCIRNGGGSKLTEVLIDFRVRYSFGGEATYLKKGSITRENVTAIIDPLRSRTDLLTYQLGLVFTF